MSKRILRSTVPVVADEPIEITPISHTIVHVDCKNREFVEIWWLDENNNNNHEYSKRSFIVFGTGQEIPNDRDYKYIGTTLTPDRELVWHLWEVF